MGALDYLTSGTPPASGTSTTSSSASVPDWYSQYIQGIAAKGTQLAGDVQNMGVPQQTIAGLTPDQLKSFSDVEANQGSWKPGVTAANDSTVAAQGIANTASTNANAAVAGPAQNWTDPGTQQSYMSPYTSAVVNEIARQGNLNFNNNIMPGVTGSMIGAGQFGSERNADVLGRAAVQNQQNISGQQASALESGYTGAENQFNQDANRQQQQQQTQASTALGAGQLGSTTNLQAGAQQGALAQTQSALQLQDAKALQAVGQQQQQQTQAGLDTDYDNTVAQQQAGFNNLNTLSSIIRGDQLPTSQTSTTTAPLTRSAGTSPLGALAATAASVA